MTDSISSAEFREALAHFASGVTVVAASDPEGVAGFTATGFTSVSLSPPLILVCVGKKASIHDRIVQAPFFGVSVLAERQAWIAEQFARSGVDRFLGVALRAEGAERAPLVEGALVQLECQRHGRHDAGDHTILVGKVVGGAIASGRPLVHFARRFGGFVADGAPGSGASKGASRGEQA
jgi:flavin reductase ActVB